MTVGGKGEKEREGKGSTRRITIRCSGQEGGREREKGASSEKRKREGGGVA